MELSEVFDMGLDWWQWLILALMPLTPLLLYIGIGLYWEHSAKRPLKRPCINCGEYALIVTGHAIWDGLKDGRRAGGVIDYARCQKCGSKFRQREDKWESAPPEMKKRVERVPLASHIIVGTAKNLRVVELVDGQIHEVVPEPLELEKQFVEIEIEVEEVMYPSHWQAGTTIRHYYRGGLGLECIRRDCIGQRKIYLMKSLSSQTTEAEYQAIKSAGEGEVFVQAYGWDLADDYERKFQFDNLVAARIEREAAEIKRDSV